MDLSHITNTLKDQPQISSIVEALQPFLPAMKREGKAFADELIDKIVNAEWTEVNQFAWAKMTDDERDELSNQILEDARNTVDQEYERKALARQVAFKVASSLMLSLL